MSIDVVAKGIQDILKFGINLDLNSFEEIEEYILLFIEWFSKNTEFSCFPLEPYSCTIETKGGSPMCEIWIEDSTMRIIPHHEDLFAIITDILRFIAKEHNKFLDDFRGKEQGSKIVKPSEVKNLGIAEDEENSDEETTEEEEWL